MLIRYEQTPISTIQNEIDLLKVDHEKFQKILKQYDIRKTKIIDTIAHEKAELARKGRLNVSFFFHVLMMSSEDNLAQAASELERLNDVVKSQNLTPEEVIRMTTDHETLARNLEDLKQNIARTHSAVMSLEVNVTNRATSTEEELDTYTSMLSALGLFPPLPPPLEGVNFVLELNTATSDPSQLLIGSDIKTLIKPNLNLVAETKRMERADVENERLRADHELDQLMTECENLDLDTSELDKKVAALNQQADDLRDVGCPNFCSTTFSHPVLVDRSTRSARCEQRDRTPRTRFGSRQKDGTSSWNGREAQTSSITNRVSHLSFEHTGQTADSTLGIKNKLRKFPS